MFVIGKHTLTPLMKTNSNKTSAPISTPNTIDEPYPTIQFELTPQRTSTPQKDRRLHSHKEVFTSKSAKKNQARQKDSTLIRDDVAVVTKMRKEVIALEIKLMQEKHTLQMQLLKEQISTEILRKKFYLEKLKEV